MDIFNEIKAQALSVLNLHQAQVEHLSDIEIRHYLEAVVREAATEVSGFKQLKAPEEMIARALDDLIGLGPLETLLKDPEISEIMVNRYDQVFVEKQGKIQRTPHVFSDELSVRRAIERIVTPLGRRIDESAPMVDARLNCGSRVNAVIPPLALDGSAVTIRKFSQSALFFSNLIEFGTCTEAMAAMIKAAVQLKQNIVISGGTGSGKTTLLNICSGEIGADERVITIEDAAELSLRQKNIVRLESKPANQEGEGAISIRQLLVNALRMRPDRIVIGECRGAESLDMLQAMNTGHDGSMTTLHANTPRDALRRLETMVLMAGIDFPLAAIRQQVASAIQLIIQIARDSEGKRRITSITEVQGMEGDVLRLSEIFYWNAKTQAHEATGEIPTFLEYAVPSVRENLMAYFEVPQLSCSYLS